jgi:hypothetical protein
MNVSNLTVNLAILSRSSSNPKLMLGRESAIEGASAEESGGRIMLVDSDGSKAVDMTIDFPSEKQFIEGLDFVFLKLRRKKMVLLTRRG